MGWCAITEVEHGLRAIWGRAGEIVTRVRQLTREGDFDRQVFENQDRCGFQCLERGKGVRCFGMDWIVWERKETQRRREWTAWRILWYMSWYFLDFIFKIETDIPPLPWESQSSSGRPARRCLELDTMCSSVATQLLFYFFDILAPALFSISANTPFISLRAGRPALDALLDVDPE